MPGVMPEIFKIYTRYDQLGLSDILAPVTKALEATKDLDGDYYEFGIYAGCIFHHAQREAGRLRLGEMNFWGFDSFQGLPVVDANEAGSFVSGSYACSRELVENLHEQFGVDWTRTHLIEGWFDQVLTDTLAVEKGMRPVSVVLVDCDLYQSTVPVLKFIAPLLQTGTIILFDDWGNFGGDDKGEKRAFREFLLEHPEWSATDFLDFGWNGYDRHNGKAFVMRKVGEARRPKVATKNFVDDFTVVIPTSPIPSHPSTAKIEKAIASIRKHLPDVEILIQCDGVRQESENRREAYEEYKRNLVWKCNHEFHNVLPIVFPEYLHQTEMMHRTIPMIKTPLLMFLEHDWEILDKPIDWEGMSNAIQKGAVNQVRLCRWSQIHEQHEYLVVGRDVFEGFPFVKIQQWSGHPHIAGVEYYKRLLSNTSRNTRSLLESWAYGLTQNVPWDVWKTAVYNPEGDIKRIEHNDGREGDPVFEPQL